MQASRVGFATAVCAVLLFAGCGTSISGRSLRADWVSARTGSAAVAAPSSEAPHHVPSTAELSAPTSVLPDTSLKPKPKVANVTVSGSARGLAGATFGSVVIGFRKLTCPACAPSTVRTDGRGAYSVSVPMDTYVVSCVALPYVCTVAGSEELAATVAVRSDTRLDLSVQDGASPNVWGHVVTTEGEPVPHVTIVLLPVQSGREFFTGTLSDGSYRLAAGSGVFLVACITPDPGYQCGPIGGHGVPYPVLFTGGPQRIEFLLCRSQDYPGCLSR